MITDPNAFLHSLCLFLVATAATQSPAVTLVYPPGAAPYSLFRNKIIEPALDPVSVLRIYGGPGNRGNEAQPRRSIQVETTGTGEEATLARAEAIYECLMDPTIPGGERPLAGGVIPAFPVPPATQTQAGQWRIISIQFLQRPGKTGLDDRGRPRVAFNFDVGFAFIA